MIYKLKSNRVSRTYLGGNRIEAFTKETVSKQYFPEDWTASVVTAFSGVSENESEGLGVTEEGHFIKELVGEDVLPILVKLLDSDERLVIQAHPTVEFSKSVLGKPFGKTECWYFLECAPEACVYLGFKPGVTREQWKNAIQTQDGEKMLSMLWKVPVKAGDFVFVDGGVPHAIGAGCFMIELQEPSDLMVVAEKYTPSGREIPDIRMDMGMGFEKALEVYDYTTYTETELKNKFCPVKKQISEGIYQMLGTELTDKFSMHMLKAGTTFKMKRKYGVAIVTAGSGKINGVCVKKGDRIFIADEGSVCVEGKSEFEVVVCQ